MAAVKQTKRRKRSLADVEHILTEGSLFELEIDTEASNYDCLSDLRQSCFPEDVEAEYDGYAIHAY